MSINRIFLRWALVRAFLQWLIVVEILVGSTLVASGECIVRIDSHFRLEDFKRNGDGYKVTIRNDSVNAFSDFLVVILGNDVNGITVFRREFPVDFMEGTSQRTFFVPGYDDRVFEVKLRILAPDYEALLR